MDFFLTGIFSYPGKIKTDIRIQIYNRKTDAVKGLCPLPGALGVNFANIFFFANYLRVVI